MTDGNGKKNQIRSEDYDAGSILERTLQAANPESRAGTGTILESRRLSHPPGDDHLQYRLSVHSQSERRLRLFGSATPGAPANETNESITKTAQQRNSLVETSVAAVVRVEKLWDLYLGKYNASSPDWDLPGPTSRLYFTAVELIVILPRLVRNHWVANRFCSNGIDYSLHRFILVTHRPEHRGTGVALDDSGPKPDWVTIKAKDNEIVPMNNILKWYQDAMRPGPSKGKENPDWILRNHQIPTNWNATDISMTGYKSTLATHSPSKGKGYHRRSPPISISFIELWEGIGRLPEGADAGDLTRMMKYARGHVAQNDKEFMFPDDIQLLKDLIGSWRVTVDHTDPAAFAKWAARQELVTEGRFRGNRRKTNPTQQSIYLFSEKRRLAFAHLSDQEYANPVNFGVTQFFNYEDDGTNDTPLYGLIREDPVIDLNDSHDDAYVLRLALSPAHRSIDYTWQQDREYFIDILRRARIASLNKILREDDTSAPLMREIDIAAAPVEYRSALLVARLGINVHINWRMHSSHIDRIRKFFPLRAVLSLHDLDILIGNPSPRPAPSALPPLEDEAYNLRRAAENNSGHNDVGLDEEV